LGGARAWGGGGAGAAPWGPFFGVWGGPLRPRGGKAPPPPPPPSGMARNPLPLHNRSQESAILTVITRALHC